MRRFLMVLCALALAACVENGVPLVEEKDRILTVPAIDDSYAPAPLRVGVYIAPEAANAHLLSDLRGTANGNLLSYGKLGPGILSGVTEYFPKAFADVYVLSDFPHVVVDAADLDAVIVFESAQASGHTHGTAMMEPINDVLLKMGVYSPAGQRLLGYQVAASTKVVVETDLNIVRAVARGYEWTPVVARNAVRLALLKFPAKEVQAAALADRARRAGALTAESVLRERAQEMNRFIVANAAPKIVGTPRDALEWAGGMARTVNALAVVGGALSAGLTAIPAASGAATVSGALSNMIANANTPGSQSGRGSDLLMEFIGGVAGARLQRELAMGSQAVFGRPSAPPELCQQINRVAATCTADSCKALFRQTALGLSCALPGAT